MGTTTGTAHLSRLRDLGGLSFKGLLS